MKNIVQEDHGSRQRLLQAALELFTSKGYAATTVREVVTAAGVTKPVLYYYFGNKEGIFLELMQSTYATFVGRTSELTGHRGSARERLVHFCTGIFDALNEHLEVARLIYSIYFGPPQGAPHFPYDRFFDGMLIMLRNIVHEGIETREFRAVDENDATWAVISALNTVMEEQLCHTPPRVDRNGLVRMLDIIISGMEQGAPS